MNRVKKFTDLFVAEGCDAFLITDPINLYYLTGLHLSSGTLVLQRQKQALIVDGRYFEVCKKHFSPVYLKNEISLKDALKGASNLGIESENTSVASYLELQKEAEIQIVPKENLLSRLRAIKDAKEIEILRQAAKLGSLGYEHIKSLLKPGITEEELSLEVEYFWRKKGAEGVAFDPIIAFGKNSSMPHYRASSTRLKSGDIVLIDIGVKFKSYHSDMTRTLFFGKPSPELESIYAIVKEAQKSALAILKPGVTVEELDDAARLFIASKGYGDKFCHSLGHGIGLQIHEYPILKRSNNSSRPLEAGMVLTIEPGIYIPDLGGVRIEDTVLITEHGYEPLTLSPYA